MEKINKYSAFLFPVLLALPDLAINLAFIHLRYLDLLTYFLFIINLPKFLKRSFYSPKIFYLLLFLLIFYAFMSIFFRILYDGGTTDFIDKYELFKFLGSIPFIFVITLIAKNYSGCFFKGAIVGGIIYIISVFNNYSKIVEQGLIETATSAKIKKEISFQTLNPNAVATLAAILGWINLISFSKYKKLISLVVSLVLFSIPFVIFARAMSIGLVVSFFVMFLLVRKSFKFYLYLAVLIVIIVLIAKPFIYLEYKAIETAWSINIKTGEGFSGRFDTWKEGILLIMESPILGHGYGTEEMLYLKNFGGKMSHNIILHYLIELGFVGLFLFIGITLYLIKKNLSYIRFKNIEAIIKISFLLSFIIADIAGQVLYLNKYAFIIFILNTKMGGK